jgi:hypothetical protein
VGEIKKFKLYDRLKALELRGKQLGMFIQKVEHSGKVSLEELVSAANREDA